MSTWRIAMMFMIGAILSASVSGSGMHAERVDRLGAMLLALGPVAGECPTTCLYCPYCSCESSEHINDWWPLDEETHQGEIHGCGFAEHDCFEHSCDPHEEDAQQVAAALDELEMTIPRLDAKEIRILEAKETRVLFNERRRALQVLGCGETTLLSVRLDDEVVDALLGI